VPDRPRGQTYVAFGDYVRSQRKLAQLTLRQAAELARISNPYLSQIEHGLALPSVTVISALADALQVSADALLLQAAGIGNRDTTTHSALTEDAIRHDQRLDEAQKKALLAVLTVFVGPSPRSKPALVGEGGVVAKGAASAASPAPRPRQTPTGPGQRKRTR
jgi:transcriptional regulator with XRE-family HTH domain